MKRGYNLCNPLFSGWGTGFELIGKGFTENQGVRVLRGINTFRVKKRVAKE
jgi:hypothetical protein